MTRKRGVGGLHDRRPKPRQGPSRNRSDQRIVVVSALVSIGIHAVILKTPLPESNPEDHQAATPTFLNLKADQPIYLVQILPEEPGEVAVLRPPVEPVIPEPSPLPTPLPRTEGSPDQVGETESARDRLVPRAGDLRYWAPVGVRPRTRTMKDPGPSFAEALGALLDSVAAEEAKRAEATEWLFVDDQGRRWGASPGFLHFGSFAIPYCGGGFSSDDCGFGVAPGKAEGARNRRRVDSMINQSAYRQSMREFWKDRAAAMNARKEDARRTGKRSGG